MTTGGVPLRGTWTIAEPETPPFAASLAHGGVFTLVIAFGDCGQAKARPYKPTYKVIVFSTRVRDRRRMEGDGTADEEIAGGDDQCGNPTMIGEAMNGGAIAIYR